LRVSSWRATILFITSIKAVTGDDVEDRGIGGVMLMEISPENQDSGWD
jgi:hypothetical protein